MVLKYPPRESKLAYGFRLRHARFRNPEFSSYTLDKAFGEVSFNTTLDELMHIVIFFIKKNNLP